MLLRFEGSLESHNGSIVSTYDVENGEKYRNLSKLKKNKIYNHYLMSGCIDYGKITKINFINGFGVTIGDSIIGLNVCDYIKSKGIKTLINVVRPCTTSDSVEEIYLLAKETGIIDEIQKMPYPLEECKKFDLNVDHGNQLYRQDFNDTEMHDYFYKNSGLNPIGVPREFKSNQWLRGMKNSKHFPERSYVLFCPNASTPLRTIPLQYHKTVISNLYKKYRKPILGFSPIYNEHYTNISKLITDTSKYINIIRNANFVYTSDSSALHIAAGFNIPCHAIFTSINPMLRIKYYKNITYDLLGIITQLEHTLLMMKSYCNILTKDLGDTIQMFRIKFFLPLFLIISCCVNAGTTIPGIELKSKKGSIFIDNKTFNEFPKITIDTSTPWTKKARFEGVKISSILQHYGLTGQKIRIDALNEYWVEIPYEDTMKYDLILADKMNGETLPTRTFGPYWMLYPIDDFPEELKKPLYNSRLIWQVRSIYVN